MELYRFVPPAEAPTEGEALTVTTNLPEPGTWMGPMAADARFPPLEAAGCAANTPVAVRRMLPPPASLPANTEIAAAPSFREGSAAIAR
ncbi:MAG TPA: hypothetical protein P5055_13670, partial [Candidatus Paceibacterota bacterium]|nr:hypothetical protein [Candidatus Paceibacterota bacterium]